MTEQPVMTDDELDLVTEGLPVLMAICQQLHSGRSAIRAVLALCDRREAEDRGLVRIVEVRAAALGGCTRCSSDECRCAELFADAPPSSP